MERRAIEIQKERGAGGCLASWWSLRRPDVFADRDTCSNTADIPQLRRLATLCEVPRFVENAVVRQELLVIHTDNASAGNHCCGVRDAALDGVVVDHPFFERVDKPDHGCAPTGCLRKTSKHLEVLLDKPLTENKILGGIPDDGEFGDDKHIGIDRFGPAHRLEDPLLVSGEVPDGEINLCSRDPDLCHRSETVSSMRKSTTPIKASRSSAPEAMAPW